ncbi:hypothetical protein J6590_054436 [Homalodisca vitripennis]|nr:hypothetical protein J6590_054436 [Homalodisca vitripennis]
MLAVWVAMTLSVWLFLTLCFFIVWLIIYRHKSIDLFTITVLTCVVANVFTIYSVWVLKSYFYNLSHQMRRLSPRPPLLQTRPRLDSVVYFSTLVNMIIPQPNTRESQASTRSKQSFRRYHGSSRIEEVLKIIEEDGKLGEHELQRSSLERSYATTDGSNSLLPKSGKNNFHGQPPREETALLLGIRNSYFNQRKSTVSSRGNSPHSSERQLEEDDPNTLTEHTESLALQTETNQEASTSSEQPRDPPDGQPSSSKVQFNPILKIHNIDDKPLRALKKKRVLTPKSHKQSKTNNEPE